MVALDRGAHDNAAYTELYKYIMHVMSTIGGFESLSKFHCEWEALVIIFTIERIKGMQVYGTCGKGHKGGKYDNAIVNDKNTGHLQVLTGKFSQLRKTHPDPLPVQNALKEAEPPAVDDKAAPSALESMYESRWDEVAE